MKFNLIEHNERYEKKGYEHGPNCFCKLFKDGEEMWNSDIPTDIATEEEQVERWYDK